MDKSLGKNFHGKTIGCKVTTDCGKSIFKYKISRGFNDEGSAFVFQTLEWRSVFSGFKCKKKHVLDAYIKGITVLLEHEADVFFDAVMSPESEVVY